MSERRPPSILWFARIQFAALGLGLVNSIVAWPRQLANAEATDHGAGFLLFNVALALGIVLLLIWLIAYRRSTIAKWIFVIFNFAGLVLLAWIWPIIRATYEVPSLIVMFFQSALQLASIGLLFRRDSRNWFEGRPPVDPEIFR